MILDCLNIKTRSYVVENLKRHASSSRVQFEISDLGFEMQDSSNFKISLKKSSRGNLPQL
jgi:hypothetical protein